MQERCTVYFPPSDSFKKQEDSNKDRDSLLNVCASFLLFVLLLQYPGEFDRFEGSQATFQMVVKK